MMLRVDSRVSPTASSARAAGVCEAPKRSMPGSRVAMKVTERSQNAQVPSNSTIPCARAVAAILF
jgi:hypothetical protein